MPYLIVLILLNCIFAQPVTANDNEVHAVVGVANTCYFSGNSISSGTEVEWGRSWILSLVNEDDGGGTLTSPKITMESELDFVSIDPDNSEILTINEEKNTYVWDFSAIDQEVEEPLILDVCAVETYFSEPVFFSASREIEPEYLTDDTTIQTVTVNFTLTEPLSENINLVTISLLSQELLAYGWEGLISTEIKSQNNVDGWSVYNPGGSVGWDLEDMDSLEVGKKYTFIAEIEVRRSQGLVGDLKIIPDILIGFSDTTNFSQQYGSSVTISHPEGVNATFEVANEDVMWAPVTTSSSRYTFGFNSSIESIGHLISGRITTSGGDPVSGVVLTGLPGEPVSDENGYYGEIIEDGWSGIVVPKMEGCIFSPEEYTYSLITSDISEQNFTLQNSNSTDNIVLTDTDNAVTINSGQIALIYGSMGVNHITLESGANAQLINFPGNNIITIQSNSDLFSVSRSGASVTLEGTDETTLKIPATMSTQEIIFDDVTLNLAVISNQVMLGSQIITLSSINIDAEEEDPSKNYCIKEPSGSNYRVYLTEKNSGVQVESVSLWIGSPINSFISSGCLNDSNGETIACIIDLTVNSDNEPENFTLEFPTVLPGVYFNYPEDLCN